MQIDETLANTENISLTSNAASSTKTTHMTVSRGHYKVTDCEQRLKCTFFVFIFISSRLCEFFAVLSGLAGYK